jgi:orotate phosphoribosyltransferase
MNNSVTKALFELLKSIAFERKKVVLASGKESNFYIDCRKVSLHPEGLVWCGQALYEHAQQLPIKIDGVGGPTLGADPLVASFAYTAFQAGNPLPAFIVRKAPKGHGTGKWVEGMNNMEPEADVILLEDVVTTGGSTVKAIKVCRQEGLNPVHVICLVNRMEGGQEAIEATGVTFSSLYNREDFMGKESA